LEKAACNRHFKFPSNKVFQKGLAEKEEGKSKKESKAEAIEIGWLNTSLPRKRKRFT
jgi:hypothetical protein